MDVSPKQIVSVATALIPFLEHDDANRALMGANMQRQAVPLVRAEAPYIGTGIEARAARDAADMIIATDDGVVIEVDGTHRSRSTTRRRARKVLQAAQVRAVQPGHLHQPEARVVAEGEKVKTGDILADGPSTDNGELALGKNLLVAFMPWEGYNFEDAIILSRAPGEGRRAHVDPHPRARGRCPRHEARPRGDHPGHPEPDRGDPRGPRRARDHPRRRRGRPGRRAGRQGHAEGRDRAHPRGAPPPGHLRREGPRGARHLAQGAPRRDRQGHRRQGVQTATTSHELPPGVNQLVRVYVGQKRKISVGDKLAGRHGNKGVISRILPIEDMPFMADGTPGRHHPQPARRPVSDERRPGPRGPPRLRRPVGLGVDGRAARSATSRCAAPRRKTRPTTPPATLVATPVFDGAKWDEDEQAGQAPDHPEIFENLTPGGTRGRRRRPLIADDGKTTLYNGRTGEPYDNPITVGYVYILKLAHLVDDKIHARSTGPYSMITQQPLGGKAQFGGQRFGEMEVWALEAYGAAYCLQELLTIKSDDVLGRVKVYEAIVKGENIPEPGIPESFKVLIKEMQALCLNVEVLSTTGEEIEMRELDEDIFRTAEELGIDLSRPERGQ